MTTRRKVSKKRQAKKAPAKKAASRSRPKKKAPAKKRTLAAVPASDNVVELRRLTELSITQLSLDTGMTRRTIRKRIADANIEQARFTSRGWPVYRLRDVLPALFHETGGVTDPDKLRPFERRAFYQGEQEKLKIQQELGELVPSFEVERQLAHLFKTITQRLETLPDILERDAGISGEALTLAEAAIDEIREELYRQAIDDDATSDHAQRA